LRDNGRQKEAKQVWQQLCMISILCYDYVQLTKVCSLEQAQEDPSQLSQDTIIQRLDPQEQARLDKVRNIGIAVRSAI
jgi:hypothetical protein